MKKLIVCLLPTLLVVATGCGPQGTSGGPGATGSGTRRGVVTGQADETFTLSAPTLATDLKQGESKVVKIGINRGKNFDEDVALRFSELPKGVTITPASPVLKHGEREEDLTAHAADDAALGDHVITLVGHPTKGADATTTFKITIKKK
jgi:hypothetical protein